MKGAAATTVMQCISCTLSSKGTWSSPIFCAPLAAESPFLLPAPPAGVMQSTCAAGQGGFAQQQMHEAWQAYLDFEMRNPQRLEAAALAARVLHAYEQALMVLLHYPEVRQPAAGQVVLKFYSAGCA